MSRMKAKFSAKPDMLAEGEQTNPVCPHCGVDPVSFRTGRTRTKDGTIVFFAFCSNRNCRALLALQMIGMDEPRVVPASGSMIVRN